MSKITVVKPFTYSTPGVERHFRVGDHEIDEATAAHPWIKAGADGHIKAAKLDLVEAEKDEKPEAKGSKGR